MARKTWGEHIHNLTIANNQKTSEALLQRTQTEQGKLSYDWCKENLRIQKEKKGPEILSDMEIQHILYKAGTTICRIFDKELNKIPMKNIEE